MAGRSICVVEFKTPTRIKHNNRYLIDEIPFNILFGRLSGRLRELINVYTDNHCDNDFKELVLASTEVGTIVSDSEFVNISRVSTRTGDKCLLDGFTGQILYTGNMTFFADVLSYLPWISVGSSTAFGCGWCSLKGAT